MTAQTEPDVVTESPVVATAVREPDHIAVDRATTGPVGGGQIVRRVIILVFGLVQLVIALRFILVLVDARAANALVSAILNVSQVFVAPFNGILNVDALVANGSVIDIAAIVAFIGWTLLELVILWAVGIFRREAA